MDISADIRALLGKVARDVAAAEGAVAGHMHFLSAMNHLTLSVRQEFDQIVTHGLFSESEAAPVEPIAPDVPVADDAAKTADQSSAETAKPVKKAKGGDA